MNYKKLFKYNIALVIVLMVATLFATFLEENEFSFAVQKIILLVPALLVSSLLFGFISVHKDWRLERGTKEITQAKYFTFKRTLKITLLGVGVLLGALPFVSLAAGIFSDSHLVGPVLWFVYSVCSCFIAFLFLLASALIKES